MAFRSPRKALALALAASAACVAAVSAADRPPTSLHLVGDHWTAWNPPTNLPPDAKVPIGVKGDTLWAFGSSTADNDEFEVVLPSVSDNAELSK